MVVFATLCYLMQKDRVLRLRETQGLFGGGKWNGPGGKLAPRETPECGAAREMKEETGLTVDKLSFRGILNFYLGDSKELDQTVFVFSCEQSSGELQSSREGELKWFPLNEIPLDEMWSDDKVWLPQFLQGDSLVGDFYYSENYKQLVAHKLRKVTFA